MTVQTWAEWEEQRRQQLRRDADRAEAFLLQNAPAMPAAKLQKILGLQTSPRALAHEFSRRPNIVAHVPWNAGGKNRGAPTRYAHVAHVGPRAFAHA